MLTSPQCLCCPAPVEDDAHAVSGCPGTGAADCLQTVSRIWAHTLVARGVIAPVALPPAWVSAHLLQLDTGLIPLSVYSFLGAMPAWLAPCSETYNGA